MKKRTVIVMMFIIMMVTSIAFAQEDPGKPVVLPSSQQTEQPVLDDPDQPSVQPTATPSNLIFDDPKEQEVKEEAEEKTEWGGSYTNPQGNGKIKKLPGTAADDSGVSQKPAAPAPPSKPAPRYYYRDPYSYRGSVAPAPPKPQPQFAKGNDAHKWAKDVVEQLKKEKLLVGYPDGSFRMKVGASRQEVSAIVDRVLTALDSRLTKSEKEIKDAKDEIIAKIVEKKCLSVSDLTTALLPLGERLKKIEDQLAQKEEWKKRMVDLSQTKVWQILLIILIIVVLAGGFILFIFLLPDPNNDQTGRNSERSEST